MRFYFLIAVLVSFSVASRAQTLQQALDAPSLTWITSGTGGSPGWIGQTTTSHDGVSAAKTALANSSPQTATLQTTVTGPGTLTFWWYGGSTEDLNGSQLSFVVGSVTQATVLDFAHWAQQTVYIGSGSQTLKWVYTLLPFAPSPTAFPGYVDQVTWTTGTTAPLILAQPFSQSVIPGLNVTFSVSAGGTPPLFYRWQLNGTNVPGATNLSCTISNVQAANLGNYRVVVSNSVGTNTSADASLEFGQVAVWGANSSTDTRAMAPPGATNVQQISGGWQHNLLLRTDNTVLNWGATNVAQTNVVGNGSNVLHGAALNNGGVILNDDGTVSAWGDSSLTNIPPNLTNVVAIAQGSSASYCLALTSDGRVIAWGGGPAVPLSVSNIVSVAAGQFHCVALRSDGLLKMWGDNTYGQISPPANLFASYPTNKIVAIAAGGYHSLALKADGTVVAWGLGDSGQTNVPAAAKGSVAIAAGFRHSMALRTNGVVLAWGQGFFGQTNVPPRLTNVVAISAGAFHSLALVGSGPVASASAANQNYSSNSFSLSIPTQCGRIFELDYKTSLTDTNWTPLPYVAGNGASLFLADPTATNSQRFYRVRRW